MDSEYIGILPKELEEVFGVREVWAFLLMLLPLPPGSRQVDKYEGLTCV